MKKSFKRNVFTAVATMSMLTSLVAGCGKNKVETIEVQSGTLQRDFVVGDDVDKVFDGLKLVVKYSDGSTKTLTKNDVEIITDFTTATAGKYPVKIRYDGKEIVVNLRVVSDASDLSTIVSISQPDSLVYRKGVLETSATDEEGFYVTNNSYKVGDDNPFKFLPKVSYETEDDNFGYLSSYKSVSKIELKKNDGTFEELTGAALTAMVAIDETKSTYKFTGDAVGKEFKLTVRPNCDIYTCYPTVGSVSTTFEVVDGYNVTDAKELLLMVNDHAEDGDFDLGGEYQSNVNEFLSNNDIKPATISSLVFQNNINITKDDLPSFMFNNGYLKDYADIYTLKLNSNQNGKHAFNIYGNYFTLRTSDIPKVDTASALDNVSHSSVIKVHSDKDNKGVAEFNVYDLKSIGNGHRQNSSDGFGGLIFMKSQTLNSKFDNVIIRSYYINNYVEMRSQNIDIPANLTLNHVKSYDPYQNFLFAWGGERINVTNSEFKRAGGPAMILQHRVVNEKFDSYVPNTELTNVVIEDKLLGNEAWFTTLPGLSGIAGYIKSLNALVKNTATANNTTASFLDADEMIEILSVNMSNGMSPTGTKAQGLLKIDRTIVANLMDNIQYKVNNEKVTIEGVTYNVEKEGNTVSLTNATTVFVPTTTVDYYNVAGKVETVSASSNDYDVIDINYTFEANGKTYLVASRLATDGTHIFTLTDGRFTDDSLSESVTYVLDKIQMTKVSNIFLFEANEKIYVIDGMSVSDGNNTFAINVSKNEFTDTELTPNITYTLNPIVATNELAKIHGETYTHRSLLGMDVVIKLDNNLNPVTNNVYVVKNLGQGAGEAAHKISYALATADITYDKEKNLTYPVSFLINNPVDVLLGGDPNPIAIYDEDEEVLYSIMSQADIVSYITYRLTKDTILSNVPNFYELERDQQGVILISAIYEMSQQDAQNTWVAMDSDEQDAILASVQNPLTVKFQLNYFGQPIKVNSERNESYTVTQFGFTIGDNQYILYPNSTGKVVSVLDDGFKPVAAVNRGKFTLNGAEYTIEYNYVLAQGNFGEDNFIPLFGGMPMNGQVIYVDLMPDFARDSSITTMFALQEIGKKYVVNDGKVTLPTNTLATNEETNTIYEIQKEYIYNDSENTFSSKEDEEREDGYTLYNNLNRSVPVFESSNGGIMYANADSTALVNPYGADNLTKFLSGDYVTIYYLGMAIVLKYNH